MSNIDTETVADGLTPGEANYFNTGGDVNEDLLNEHKETPPAELVALLNEHKKTPPAELVATPGPAEAAPPAGTEQPVEQPEVHDEPGEPGQPPKRVGWKKFQAAEERATQAERQLQEQTIKHARVEERLNLLQQALQQPETASVETSQEEMPDPEKDIFGAFKYLVARHQELQEKVNGYETQITTGQAEMEQERKYFEDINQFAASEPSFLNSYNFLLRSRAVELMAPRYPQATIEQLWAAQIPSDIGEVLRQEERYLYKDAQQRGVNAGEQIYRMATLRGFRKPAAAPAATPAAAPAMAPAAAKPAPAAAPALPGTPLSATPPAPGAPQNATAVVEAIKKGQAASQSLSNGAGAAGGTTLTPEVLANMSDADFERLFTQLQTSGDKTKLMELFGH